MVALTRHRLFVPMGVCLRTFLTLTTTVRYGLALSSTNGRFAAPRRDLDGIRRLSGRRDAAGPSSQHDRGSDALGENAFGRRPVRNSNYADFDFDEATNFDGREKRGRRRGADGGAGYDNDAGGYRGDANYDGNRDANDRDEKGRSRYSADGRKKQPRQPRSRSGRGRGGRGTGRGGRGNAPREERRSVERPPTPPLDSRPTYFTCRHTHEARLREEIGRLLAAARNPRVDAGLVSFANPHPGIVMVATDDGDAASFLSGLRPAYALQAMPDCVIVEAESTKGMARAVVGGLLLTTRVGGGGESSAPLRPELVNAPRGSLAIHSLVPEMGRGMPQSKLPQHRRVARIGEEVAAQLKKRCRAARAANPDDDVVDQNEKWLLQILLLEPNIVAASFANCAQQHLEGEKRDESPSRPSWTWPNWNLPAGLALVDIEDEQRESPISIPSSAYRKLLEAFWYLGDRPPSNTPGSGYPVVDLGACPGGWTAALRLMGCDVVAVDRSPLAPALMKDDGVEYVRGDAFRYVPPWARDAGDPGDGPGRTLRRPLPNTWMVSDIIAYPDKITELLDNWCGKQWASHAVVTIKFQSEIPWEDVDRVTDIVRGHGYSCRTVHFFNNKTEVTLLAVKDGYSNNSRDSSSGSKDKNSALLGKPMYTPTLPMTKKK